MGWRDTEDGRRELVFRVKEPISALTHFWGLLAALAGGFPLLIRAALHGRDLADLLSLAAFVGGLILLYGASSAYHTFTLSPAGIKRLKKLDHAMIYVLIAGSYTPMLMSFYPKKEALVFSLILWIVAAVGIGVKVFWFLPRWVSTAIYLLMGWSILFDLGPLTRIPTGAIVLLAAGGVSYTIGGVIYGLKKPDLFRAFGFHELFHCFVLLGSLLHYLVVAIYIL